MSLIDMSSWQLIERASLVGVGLVVCSTILFYSVPADFAPFIIMPGVFPGLFISSVVAAGYYGNAHAVSNALIVTIAGLINLPCYVAVTYAILRIRQKYARRTADTRH